MRFVQGDEVRQLGHVSAHVGPRAVPDRRDVSTRKYDSKPFYPKTEKEVFDLLGLEWVDPVWRNADA